MKEFIKQNWPYILLVAYFIFPIDFIPDFLSPIIGPIAYSDDILVAILLLLRQYVMHSRKKQGIITPIEVIDSGKSGK